MQWEFGSAQVMWRWQGEHVRKIGSELKKDICDVATGPFVFNLYKDSFEFEALKVRHTISCPQLAPENSTA